MELSAVSRSSRHIVIAVALGAGIVIGSGTTWWLFGRRLTDVIQRLSQQIIELRREIDRLRLYIEQHVLQRDLRRNDLQDFVDDDDDIYENAYDG